jgi:hypothetical protein
MNTTCRREQGQALVMVTLALIAMFGLLGLAVDVGYSYFRQRAAQAAADAGATAGASLVLELASAGGSTLDEYKCTPTGVATCSPIPTPCSLVAADPNSSLYIACEYAAENGFTDGEDNVTVTVQAADRDLIPPTVLSSADAGAPAPCQALSPAIAYPPTARCVNTYYWITVRIREQIPQLFSAVLGNTEGVSGARATAAVIESVWPGSLILLNRRDEVTTHPQLDDYPGVNFNLGGSPTVTVPGGIRMASTVDDPGGDEDAGVIDGTGDVRSPSTLIRGGYDEGSGSWEATPQTGVPDGDPFLDPFRGMPQPPLSASGSLPTDSSLYHRVVGGVINDTVCPGGVCAPGYYYAAEFDAGSGTYVATGDRLSVAANVNFQGATATSFENYVFFGGFRIANNNVVNFGPGRYVMAGINDWRNNIFETGNGVWLTGGTSETSDAGRLIILTDASYDGALDGVRGAMSDTHTAVDSLGFGPAEFKSGNNDRSGTYLYGMNPLSADLPQELKDFGQPVLIWQDRLNSNVQINPDTGYEVGCAPPNNITSCLDAAPMNANSESRQLYLGAGQFSQYGGVIYQPRGAWTHIQAGPGYTGPLRIITGAMALQGSGDLTLVGPEIPIVRRTVALIE